MSRKKFALGDTFEFSSRDRELFAGASPFPHLVIDGMFDDCLLQRIDREFDLPAANDWTVMDNRHEYKLACEVEEAWGPSTRQLLVALNSPGFTSALERLTQIQRLLPDWSFRGGGLHLVPSGGFLKVHADFQEHNGIYAGAGWRRKLNLIVYLNSGWDRGWGGEIELWDKEGKRVIRSYPALFNRTVIFLTGPSSFHGHPRPLRCPKERCRKSLALYYYRRGEGTGEASRRTAFVDS